jgi:hypothetical protein
VGVDVDPIVISTIHLDARSEEKRVQQLRTCLKKSPAYAVTPYTPSCIIAGDYNCELFDGSCIHAFLSPMTPHLLADNDKCIQAEMRTRECASALRLSSGTLPSTVQLKAWDELHHVVTKFVRCNCPPRFFFPGTKCTCGMLSIVVQGGDGMPEQDWVHLHPGYLGSFHWSSRYLCRHGLF